MDGLSRLSCKTDDSSKFYIATDIYWILNRLLLTLRGIQGPPLGNVLPGKKEQHASEILA